MKGFQLIIIVVVAVIELYQKALLLTEELNTPLHIVTEIDPCFPAVLVAIYLTWCMMGQNTGAGMEDSPALSHLSLRVVRVRRGPSESNGKRSRSRPPGAFSIPVNMRVWGEKLGGRNLYSKRG